MDEQAVGAIPHRPMPALELPAEGRVVTWEERTITERAVLACEVCRMVWTVVIGSNPTSLNLVIDLLSDLLHGDQWDVWSKSVITDSVIESGEYKNRLTSG